MPRPVHAATVERTRAKPEVLNALKGVDSRPLLRKLAEGACVSYFATSGAVPIGN